MRARLASLRRHVKSRDGAKDTSELNSQCRTYMQPESVVSAVGGLAMEKKESERS